MENMKVLESITYEKEVDGISVFSDSMVKIIGEQVVEIDGTIKEMYVYNIVGYNPENGKPFVGLKANIITL